MLLGTPEKTIPQVAKTVARAFLEKGCVSEESLTSLSNLILLRHEGVDNLLSKKRKDTASAVNSLEHFFYSKQEDLESGKSIGSHGEIVSAEKVVIGETAVLKKKVSARDRGRKFLESCRKLKCKRTSKQMWKNLPSSEIL